MYYGISWSMVMPGQSQEYSLITPFLGPLLEQCNITRKLIPNTELFSEEFESHNKIDHSHIAHHMLQE